MNKNNYLIEDMIIIMFLSKKQKYIDTIWTDFFNFLNENQKHFDENFILFILTTFFDNKSISKLSAEYKEQYILIPELLIEESNLIRSNSKLINFESGLSIFYNDFEISNMKLKKLTESPSFNSIKQLSTDFTNTKNFAKLLIPQKKLNWNEKIFNFNNFHDSYNWDLNYFKNPLESRKTIEQKMLFSNQIKLKPFYFVDKSTLKVELSYKNFPKSNQFLFDK